MPVPQHPGRAPQQQGLGAPTANVNTYYKPNVALQQAEAQRAQAGAEKQYAEAAMLQQAQQGLEPGPQVMPQEVQAQQIAEGIMQGQLGQEQLGAMIQNGDVDQRVVEAALGMVDAYQKQSEQQYATEQGLGGPLQ